MGQRLWRRIEMKKFFHSFILELETWIGVAGRYVHSLVSCGVRVDSNNSNVLCWFCAGSHIKVHSWFAERKTWYHKKEIVVFLCVFCDFLRWDGNFFHIIRYFDCCYHRILPHSGWTLSWNRRFLRLFIRSAATNTFLTFQDSTFSFEIQVLRYLHLEMTLEIDRNEKIQKLNVTSLKIEILWNIAPTIF